MGELAAHSHSASGDAVYKSWLFRGSEYARGFTSGGSYDGLGSTQNGTTAVTVTIGSTGSSTAHNNIQPYLSIYYYRRTA